MWKSNSMLKLSVFCLFVVAILTEQSYRTNVTQEEIVYWQRSLPYIQQFTNKRCTKASLMAEQRFCKKRCELMFYYIPTAKYMNYRFYNKTTKDCEPKVICPKIFTVKYNSTTNKCFDMSTGDQIPGVDAKPYPGNDTFEVEFLCVNGKVGMHKGRKQCICDFGWKTTFLPGTRQNPKYQKCNKGISIYEYLPSVVQIYYDPLLDLPYPHPADPEYWSKILIISLRQLKYSIITSIWPNQIQMTLLVVPAQGWIPEGDEKFVTWGGMLLGIILLITVYDKVKKTRKIEEAAVQEQNKSIQ